IWPEMRWILSGSVVLNVAGVWWGLPSTWAAIETVPVFVLSALAQRFSHGWFDAYPPLQYYLLSIAGTPVVLLHSRDILSYQTPAGSTLLILSYRLMSVAFAVGTVAATAFVGLHAFGKRAGVLAAGIAALVAPFIYYAKTANVDGPYVFWYSLSLVFYVRLLQESRLRDYVLFGVTATLAFCTKDQAYALYLTAPFVVIAELWRAKHLAGVPKPLAKALVDRRLLATGLAAITTFVLVCNLVFNLSGYIAHLHTITDAAARYRVFEPTAEGRWQLFLLTGRLVRDAMGWPFFAASLAGVAIGLRTSRWRRPTIWLAAAIPAYYLGLINIVLYNYDRFMLPVCVVLAVFGGLALDRLLTAGAPNERWRQALVTAAFAYSILYAATVDVLMIGDSRYLVGRWMAAHIQRGTVVGAMGLHEYLPQLEDYYVADIGTVDELMRERPRYFILNADYVRAASRDGDFARLAEGVQGGRLGYQLAFRYRRKTPLSLLPGAHPDLVGDRLETSVFSILRNVNPTIEIFQDQQRGPPNGAPDGQ
ncbi:MAG TPA: glycosyltransferase family 39 protein, partial [Vicinamibacterales bacterium]